ncbi:MAG: DUF4352 domain-containing protein [Dehalococcoidia bacterium]
MLFILSACLSGPGTPAETPQTETPQEEAEIGTSRSNPVPLGQSYRYDDLEVKVLDFERMQVIGSAQAEAGRSFAIVSLQIRNVGAPEKNQSYNTIDFAVVGDKGEVYKDWQTDIVYDLYKGESLGNGDLYGGDSVTGTIIRTVDTDDSYLVLRWSTGSRGWLKDSDGAEEIFFALE